MLEVQLVLAAVLFGAVAGFLGAYLSFRGTAHTLEVKIRDLIAVNAQLRERNAMLEALFQRENPERPPGRNGH